MNRATRARAGEILRLLSMVLTLGDCETPPRSRPSGRDREVSYSTGAASSDWIAELQTEVGHGSRSAKGGRDAG